MNNISVYLKPTIFYSAIFGLLLGVLILIPIVQLILVFVFWAIGAIIFYLLYSKGFITKPSLKEALIVGGISGFVSILFAALSFLPLYALVGLFVKNYFLKFTFSLSSLFVVLMIVLCTAGFNMIFNIFSSLAVVATINGIKNGAEEIKKIKTE